MTHKQRVLQLLSDRQPHSHIEVYRLGCVAHSRISDLRKDGHTIEMWRDGDLYLYRLVGRLDEVAVQGPDTSPDHGHTAAATSSSASPNPASPGSLPLSPGTTLDPHWDGDALQLFGKAVA